MYDFRADHLTLDNHLVHSSLGETPSLTQLSSVACGSFVGLKPRGLCPIQLAMSIDVVLVHCTFEQPC